jgi:hypothetical protein
MGMGWRSHVRISCLAASFAVLALAGAGAGAAAARPARRAGTRTTLASRPDRASPTPAGFDVAAPDHPVRREQPAPLGKGTTSSEQSLNWSGYVATPGQPLVAIETTFVQPAVQCGTPGAFAVFWVGFDGWLNDTVEQAGTAAQCDAGPVSTPTYYAWWEMYPTNFITPMPIAISPGDKIKATAVYVAASDSFLLSVSDKTDKQNYTEVASCSPELECPRLSAESIVERPETSGQYDPLADWSSVALATDKVAFTATNGHGKQPAKPHYQALGDSPDASIEMVDGEGDVLAAVSGLNRPGTRFTDTWRAYR